ncbi:MAG TPA: tetratricopeptide repeat protein [Polyangiaceae bacterium]|nr:tetratricopeptide repeat protein [Polyangiaceae bacterium]
MIETEILHAELERLFELPDLMALSRDVLGFEPESVGGTAAKASFAGALTAHCLEHDAIEALCDAVLATRVEVNSKILDLRITGVTLDEELKVGSEFGPYVILRKLGEGRLAISYVARKDGAEYRLKVLRREATRDQRGLQRYLTVTRLIAQIAHDGLPRQLSAGKIGDRYVISHEHSDAVPLSLRISRSGPMHPNEAKAVIRGILEPLAALHGRRIAHGDLRLDNVLLARAADGSPRVLLVDAGMDRLRARARVGSGRNELFSTVGSPRTVAPEQIRGLASDATSDVYSFGAMLYEIVSGKPLFGDKPALEAAFAHLTVAPPPPSSVAPPGFVSRDFDELILRLLDKDPARRPKSASEALALFESAGPASIKPPAFTVTTAEVAAKIEALLKNPDSDDAALELEASVEAGADAERVIAALLEAASTIEKDDTGNDTKKSLLFRAARLCADGARALEQAEAIYLQLTELDPEDQVAWTGLEDSRRRLGKFEEVVEMLLARSEQTDGAVERARAMYEIGKLYGSELHDTEQALVAFTQSLCEDPSQATVIAEIERLAGSNQEAWAEVLSNCASSAQDEDVDVDTSNAIWNRMGHWYVEKLKRPDLALPCFQAVALREPADEVALEGMTEIYRKAQQWSELGMALTRRADAAASPAQARELRAEAAELLELRLNDTDSARALYEQLVSEDPGQVKASDALARIYERTSDFQSFLKLSERRAHAQRGDDKLKTLCRIAEVYETNLRDDSEALKRFQAAAEFDSTSLDALRGLDRLYSKLGRFQDLLGNLAQQVEVAATPRQKVALWERIAAIYDEEFLNHEKAADALERLLAIDSANENALTALIRHCRALDRWENVAALYERQLKLVTEGPRRLALLLQQGKVLAEQIGSPERAMVAYDGVLEIDPQHAGALEALAHLRQSTGDADAALAALEALASRATSPEAKAEQYLRAAKILEARGDRDGAIERYKRALDANPKDSTAAAALREAYTARGDLNAAVQLLEREISQTEGELAKGRLCGQMALLAKSHLKDDKRAEEAAKRALGFDPTNLDALTVLGDIAFDAKRFMEAATHYEQLAGRADSLDKKEAARVLVRYVDALSQTGSTEKALAPMDTLLRIAPDDSDALARVAQVSFEHGSPKRAAELYRDLLARFSHVLTGDVRVNAHFRYGEALRLSGDIEGSLAPLNEASDLDPSASEPLVALAKVYEAQEKWAEVIKVKTRHLDNATGDERVQLLLDIGDLASAKLNDRAQAAKSFVAALEEHPDDRRLLSKLMQLYSEEKDWNKLVEVVIRLAQFVDDPKQKVKYLHTAAIVTARQIGEPARALEFYEQVLTLEPGFDKALSEAVELEQARGNHAGVERWLKHKLSYTSAADDHAGMLQTFTALGELYEKGMGHIDQAIDALEAAQTLDPDNRERTEHLSNLYVTDPSRYLDKAVAAQAVLLRQNPYRHDSYKTLRRLYTETKQADASWCLCQALTVLNLAEPDEERFYKRMRSDSAAPAQAAFSEDDWLDLVMHPQADTLLTSVFALIEPIVIARRSRAVQELGYDPGQAVDIANHSAPVCQSLYYAAGVLGIALPTAYENRNDPGGVSFLFASEPSLVLGKTALRPDVPLQPAAFIAGHKLCFFRPGLYVRHLLGSGTALRSWFFAAIKLTSPQFPVAPELEGAVNEAYLALEAGLLGQTRDQLTRVVAKLLTSGTALDLKRWVAAVDLTADRAGFVLAHDLETAAQVVKASDESSSAVSHDERFRELALFSVSSQYFEIRQRLQISVDS